MQLISQIIVVIGIVLSILDVSSAFIRPQSLQRSGFRFAERNVLSMSSIVGGGRGGRGGRGGGEKRNKPLDQREGSRPLTRAELKAKEIYDATRDPIVTRIHAPEDRVALSALVVGQKMKGRIINVKEFGMFVDIGSKKDGMVHVKDISKDYFINKIESKYAPGQDIDVWVKFVEEESAKLGLQMFPVVDRIAGARMNPTTVSLGDIDEQDEVSGTVVRVSNYGVFLDIGAGVDAFLHRRKMKLNKKSMVLKPWEIAPLGSTVKAFVHELDSRRNRISLTTYTPEQWGDMLPMKSDEFDGNMVDDEEELGGSVMAENLRALQRTLSLSGNGPLEGEDDEDDEDMDDMDDDEDDDNDDEDEGEELTAEEVRRLTSGRTQQPQIVIDDFKNRAADPLAVGKAKGKGRGFANGLTAGAGLPLSDAEQLALKKRTDAMNDQAEEISIDELFRDLCARGRDYVTVKDVKKWDYLQELMKDGELTDTILAELFVEAGATQGKLLEEQFEDFVDILADTLGLEEQGGDYDNGLTDDDDDEEEEEEEEEEKDDEELVLINDLNETEDVKPVKKSKKIKQEAEDEAPDDMAPEDMQLDFDEELNFGLGNGNTGIQNEPVIKEAPILKTDKSLSDHYEQKSKTNDLFQYVFSSVAGKKGYVSMEDVNAWEFTKDLGFSESKIKSLFAKCKPVKGGLGMAEFERLVDMLSATEKQTKEEVDAQFGDNAEVNEVPAVKVKEGVVNLTPESDRKDFIPTKALKVNVEEKPNTEEEEGANDDEISIEEAFIELAEGQLTATFEAIISWEVIDELLDDGVVTEKDLKKLFKEAGGKKKGTTMNIDEAGFEAFLDLLAPLAEGAEEISEEEVEVDSNIMKHEIINEKIIIKNENEKKSEKIHENVVTDNEDEDDDENLLNVFKELAGDKKFVSAKDLMTWDIVLELMGEGVLNDALLKEKMSECKGYNGKGVTLEGFDDLVDKLATLYGEEEGDDEDNDEEENENGDEEEEYLDIDPEELFEELAKGKSFVSLQDIQEWNLIKEMKEQGEMNDKQLLEIIKTAGVKDPKQMDITAFNLFLDELSEGMDDDDEDADELDLEDM